MTDKEKFGSILCQIYTCVLECYSAYTNIKC